MNGSTKILTVSYGTFSCTLEGFDDPLGTMRDIAEYFRDLAADDRYFGAEPPTPDVEMLQNIAQKEVQRRVETRVSETGVALRQVEADERDDMTSRVISAVVADSSPEPEDQEPRSRPEAVRKVRPAPVDVDVNDKGPLAFDDDYLLSDEPEDVLAVDPGARPPAEGPAETVAEKLRRIRAVVSRNVDQSEGRSPFSQDQAPQAVRPLRDRALTETIEQITADLAEDDDDSAADDSGEAVEERASRVSEPDVAEDLAPESPAEVEPEAEEIADTPAMATEETVAAPAQSPEPETAPDLEPDRVGEETDQVSAELGDAAERVVGPEDDEVFLSEEDQPEAKPSFAEADELVDEDVDDGWAFDDSETSGADEEEYEAEDDEDRDDVERSVTEILGKVSGRVSEPPDGEVLKLEDPIPQKPARPVSRSLGPEPEGDVGRLMAETDTKLNDDEVVRRRRVISQMRAAVAATKADRLISRQVPKEIVEEQEKSQYREDLSEVVRSSKPLPKEGERKRTGVPPLVLVSSQRVDGKGVSNEAWPQKPEPAAMTDTGGFAQFAKTMGASELPELLEAAAAYAMFSEGQPSFTRPEIMKRVARVDPTIRLSREESLRSFGQLLRQGKFKKLERGQFTIDKDTRFNPEHRFAGQ